MAKINFTKKKKFGKVPKKRFIRKNKKTSNKVTNWSVTYNHSRLPLPTRYRCRFMQELFVTLTATAPDDSSAAICANSLYKPFLIPSSAGSPGDFNTPPWSMQGGYSTNIQPVGLSNLVNTTTGGDGIYDFYKVLGCKLQISVINANNVDAGIIMAVPYIGTQRPTSGYTGANDPFAVSAFVSQSVTKNNVLTKFIRPWNVFGCTKRVYMDDVSGQYSSSGNSNPSQVITWYISYLTSGFTATVSAMTFRIKIDYWAELWTPPGKLFLTT